MPVLYINRSRLIFSTLRSVFQCIIKASYHHATLNNVWTWKVILNEHRIFTNSVPVCKELYPKGEKDIQSWLCLSCTGVNKQSFRCRRHAWKYLGVTWQQMEAGETWGMNVPYEISITCCCIMRPWVRTPLNVTLQALVRVVLQIVTNNDAKLALELNLLWMWKVSGSNTASVLPGKCWNSAWT